MHEQSLTHERIDFLDNQAHEFIVVLTLSLVVKLLLSYDFDY